MMTHPTMTIMSADGKPTGLTHPLPAIIESPIRPDVIQYVDMTIADVASAAWLNLSF